MAQSFFFSHPVRFFLSKIILALILVHLLEIMSLGKLVIELGVDLGFEIIFVFFSLGQRLEDFVLFLLPQALHVAFVLSNILFVLR